MYVVKCADKSLYTGITVDLERRLHEHNNTKKGAKYTRSRRPVDLVYCITYSNRSLASKAESAFKKLTRKQKIEIVDSAGPQEGELIWQRRHPGGRCLVIKVFESYDEWVSECTDQSEKNIWADADWPILRILHPKEGLIDDPSYYYEQLEDQKDRHDRMLKNLTNYLNKTD
jgi:putative endonuclease